MAFRECSMFITCMPNFSVIQTLLLHRSTFSNLTCPATQSNRKRTEIRGHLQVDIFSSIEILMKNTALVQETLTNIISALQREKNEIHIYRNMQTDFRSCLLVVKEWKPTGMPEKKHLPRVWVFLCSWKRESSQYTESNQTPADMTQVWDLQEKKQQTNQTFRLN